MKYELNVGSHAIDKKSLNIGLYTLIIYQLIRQHSNDKNRLTTKDIYDTLLEYWQGNEEKESAKKNLQKTIKRNLPILVQFDTNIQIEYKDGSLLSDDLTSDKPQIAYGKIRYIWYEQDLTVEDLQLLSDSIIYSRHLKKERKEELIEKILASAGQTFSKKSDWYRSVINDSEDISVPVSGDLYINLGYICEAIEEKKCLSFDYMYAGRDGAKYLVRKYSGVSPYKIVHYDGIYYLIASNSPDTAHNKLFKEHNKEIPILYLEIHKLTKMCPDPDSTYHSIGETAGKNTTLQELLSTGYHPLSHESVPFRFMGDINLRVNSRGLDQLIDRFGNRMYISRRKELDGRYDGSTKELAYTYDVTIKKARKNDWNELLILLISYPSEDIELISPEYLLEGVMFQMRGRLARLGVNYDIKLNK